MNSASVSFSPSSASLLGVLSISSHAEVRMQQRGVERALLECLLEYGARQYDHKGCEIVFLTDDCLDAIARHENHHLFVRVAAARSIYAVVDADGSLGSYLTMKIANRNTFLIDPQGKIAKVWTKVSVQHHSEEVLAAIAELKK